MRLWKRSRSTSTRRRSTNESKGAAVGHVRRRHRSALRHLRISHRRHFGHLRNSHRRRFAHQCPRHVCPGHRRGGYKNPTLDSARRLGSEHRQQHLGGKQLYRNIWQHSACEQAAAPRNEESTPTTSKSAPTSRQHTSESHKLVGEYRLQKQPSTWPERSSSWQSRSRGILHRRHPDRDQDVVPA